MRFSRESLYINRLFGRGEKERGREGGREGGKEGMGEGGREEGREEGWEGRGRRKVGTGETGERKDKK